MSSNHLCSADGGEGQMDHRLSSLDQHLVHNGGEVHLWCSATKFSLCSAVFWFLIVSVGLSGVQCAMCNVQRSAHCAVCVVRLFLEQEQEQGGWVAPILHCVQHLH